jgi:hypothetical protein
MLQWPLAGVVAKKLLFCVIISCPDAPFVCYACGLSRHVCRFISYIGISKIHSRDVITLSYLFILYFNIFIC